MTDRETSALPVEFPASSSGRQNLGRSGRGVTLPTFTMTFTLLRTGTSQQPSLLLLQFLGFCMKQSSTSPAQRNPTACYFYDKAAEDPHHNSPTPVTTVSSYPQLQGSRN